MAALKSATLELEQASAAMAQHMSAAGPPACGTGCDPARPRPSAAGADHGDVIDAEYEVKG